MIMDALYEQLESKGLQHKDFLSVTHRLLDQQSIFRDQSNAESEIYDTYLRMHDLIDDYLATIGITVVHTEHLRLVVAYPPGSKIPGQQDSDMAPALHKRIRVEEAGLLLTLRLLFEEKLREGALEQDGNTYVPLEDVYAAYRALVKRDMPRSEVDRRSLFASMKKLRVVTYEELDVQEQWIGIRETILHYTLDGVVEGMQDAGVEIDDTEEECNED